MRWIAPVGVLVAGLLLSAKISPAKPEYTRRTRKDCKFCHPPDSRKLTPAGEYFRDHGDSLNGYRPPEHDAMKAVDKSK